MKNNRGITLTALVITVIVMLIIFSISIYEGTKLIQKSGVQTEETNMLTIQAKVKAYSEEIEAKVWTESDSNKNAKRESAYTGKGFTKYTGTIESVWNVPSGSYTSYTVTGKALTDMGLDELKEQTYIVIFDNDNQLKDIVYPDGVLYNNKTYYSLSSLRDLLNGD